MQKIIITLALVVCCALSAQAQSLVSYSSPSVADYGRALCLSPASPAGGVRGTFPTIPPLPALLFPMGGAAIDQQGRRFFYSNGLQLACMPIPTLPPGIGPFGILPTPAVFNMITGLGYSAASGHLWITDGWFIGEWDFIGGAFVTGPWPTPFAGTNIRITGVEYDQASGTVIAVSQFSNLLHFTPGGALLANIPATYAPPGMATGLALETALISTAGTSRQIYVSYGNTAAEWGSGIFVPLSTAQTQGLAFVALPADLSQGAVCGPMPMNAWVNSPTYTGNAGFQAELQGGPPSSMVILGIDFSFLPVPIVLPSGSNLWLNPASMTLVPIPLPTNAFGDAVLAVPLFLPPGFLAYCQWLAICPMGGQAYCSDLLQIAISMP